MAHVVRALILKRELEHPDFGEFKMLENVNGKLMVYASSFASGEKRMRFIKVAAEKMAKVLKVNFEVVTLKEKFTPIYVYYKNGDEKPVPIILR